LKVTADRRGERNRRDDDLYQRTGRETNLLDSRD